MNTQQKVLVSGVKPTGQPHLGNYFGAMKQFVSLQHDYDTHIFVADYHALTSIKDAQVMRNNTRNLILDYLAIGLDPDLITLYKQSSLPEHAELAWIFESLVSMPYMMRAHAYKDAVANNADINVATFNYPLLMAADILMYDASVVPVGKDQAQHLEYAREVANKFNNTWGDEFIVPEAHILRDVETVPGIDGRKMSKSYGNVIPLFATNEELKKVSMSVVTGSNPKGSPNDSADTLFSILKLFLTADELPYIKKKYESGEMGYKEAKELLYENLVEFIEPMRKRREHFADNPDLVNKILTRGAANARQKAEAKMERVRRAVGLI